MREQLSWHSECQAGRCRHAGCQVVQDVQDVCGNNTGNKGRRAAQVGISADVFCKCKLSAMLTPTGSRQVSVLSQQVAGAKCSMQLTCIAGLSAMPQLQPITLLPGDSFWLSDAALSLTISLHSPRSQSTGTAEGYRRKSAP